MYQPMLSPVQTAPMFTSTSPMIAASAHGGYFNILAGFIANPSLGMPPEYMIPTSIEASVQTLQLPSAGGSAQDTQLQAPSTQLPVSTLQIGRPHSTSSVSQPMVLYQPQASSYQQGPSAPRPMTNHMDQQGGYQQQVLVYPQLVHQL
jgi:hypothetical protein